MIPRVAVLSYGSNKPLTVEVNAEFPWIELRCLGDLALVCQYFSFTLENEKNTLPKVYRAQGRMSGHALFLLACSSIFIHLHHFSPGN